MRKIMISDHETLHQCLKHNILTIGKKAQFVKIPKVFNNYFASMNENVRLKNHALLHFVHIQIDGLNRERCRPRLTDGHKEKSVMWCRMIILQYACMHKCDKA